MTLQKIDVPKPPTAAAAAAAAAAATAASATEGKEEEGGGGGGGGESANGKINREIFVPFVKQQCRRQVVTFLNIMYLQLVAEEFLYIKVRPLLPPTHPPTHPPTISLIHPPTHPPMNVHNLLSSPP